MKLKLAILLALFAVQLTSSSETPGYREWRMFGGGPENIHYTTLRHINRDNLNQLEVAWTYDTGDARERDHGTNGNHGTNGKKKILPFVP